MNPSTSATSAPAAAPKLVRLRGSASTPGAQRRHEGHVGELVANTLDRSPSTSVGVRLLSTDATMVVEPGQFDLLAPRVPPGEMRLPYRCASESFLRRSLLPLIRNVDLFEHILSFLKLPQVSMDEVVALRASSSAANDAQCSPAHTLTTSDSTWWLSAPDTCPNGLGNEWVLYRLRPDGKPARLQFVQMKVPKLPYGPLSVRVFHLEGSDDESGPFARLGPDLTTFDTDRLQEWALLKPVECAFVRVVLTMNAAASELEDKWLRLSGMRLSEASSIGFLRIAFA